MLQFLYVAPSKQNFDSSTDQGETASVECPFAAGRLQITVSATKGEEREETNVSSCSSRLKLGEERERPQVS
jgi:hypothetical protein